MCKKSFKLTIVYRFLKNSSSIDKGKMELIQLAYGLPKETVTAIKT